MAENGGQDLLAKLAERGEEALGRLSDAPGGARITEAIRGLRERMDEMQRHASGVDALEKRVEELEKRLARLEGKPAGAATGAPKPAAAAKPKPKAKPRSAAPKPAPKPAPPAEPT
jgi:TolA-binding protein